MDMDKRFKEYLRLSNEDFKCNSIIIKDDLDITTNEYEDGIENNVSDELWDAVQIKYSKLVKPYDFGSETNSGGLAETEHTMSDIGGISDKITNTAEANEYLDSIKNVAYFISSYKYDGMSFMCDINSEGEITKAITRGKNGKGVDFTKLFAGFKPLDEEIYKDLYKIMRKKLFTQSIRFEIIIKEEQFNKYKIDRNYDFKDKRSCVAGMMKKALFGSLDNITEYITMKPFKIEFSNMDIARAEIELNCSAWLASNLFIGRTVGDATSIIFQEYGDEDYDTFFLEEFESNNDIFTTQAWYANKRKDLDYDIDGVVYVLLDEHLNEVGKFAYKFDAFSVETELLDVEWDFSPKSGIYTPMGIIDVLHAGKSFKRVSLANYGRYKAENFTVGSKVNFTYRSDVMGYLDVSEHNLTNTLNAPTHCAHCHADLVILTDKNGSETFLKCTNPNCSGMDTGRILNHVQKLGLKGIDIASIEQLNKEYQITTLREFYSLSIEDISKMEGFKDKRSANLLQAIHSKRDTTVFDFELLGSLNINSIGRTTSELILTHIDLLTILSSMCSKEDYDSVYNKLLSISGIESLKAKYLLDGLPAVADDINYLLFMYPNYVNVKDTIITVDASETKTFVVTGSVTKFKNRGELERYVKTKGHKTSGSVSAKTDYLVNNDSTSTSGKNKTAIDLGIKIITEDELIELLG